MPVEISSCSESSVELLGRNRTATVDSSTTECSDDPVRTTSAQRRRRNKHRRARRDVQRLRTSCLSADRSSDDESSSEVHVDPSDSVDSCGITVQCSGRSYTWLRDRWITAYCRLQQRPGTVYISAQRRYEDFDTFVSTMGQWVGNDVGNLPRDLQQYLKLPWTQNNSRKEIARRVNVRQRSAGRQGGTPAGRSASYQEARLEEYYKPSHWDRSDSSTVLSRPSTAASILNNRLLAHLFLTSIAAYSGMDPSAVRIVPVMDVISMGTTEASSSRRLVRGSFFILDPSVQEGLKETYVEHMATKCAVGHRRNKASSSTEGAHGSAADVTTQGISTTNGRSREGGISCWVKSGRLNTKQSASIRGASRFTRRDWLLYHEGQASDSNDRSPYAHNHNSDPTTKHIHHHHLWQQRRLFTVSLDGARNEYPPAHFSAMLRPLGFHPLVDVRQLRLRQLVGFACGGPAVIVGPFNRQTGGNQPTAQPPPSGFFGYGPNNAALILHDNSRRRSSLIFQQLDSPSSLMWDGAAVDPVGAGSGRGTVIVRRYSSNGAVGRAVVPLTWRTRVVGGYLEGASCNADKFAPYFPIALQGGRESSTAPEGNRGHDAPITNILRTSTTFVASDQFVLGLRRVVDESSAAFYELGVVGRFGKGSRVTSLACLAADNTATHTATDALLTGPATVYCGLANCSIGILDPRLSSSPSFASTQPSASCGRGPVVKLAVAGRAPGEGHFLVSRCAAGSALLWDTRAFKSPLVVYREAMQRPPNSSSEVPPLAVDSAGRYVFIESSATSAVHASTYPAPLPLVRRSVDVLGLQDGRCAATSPPCGMEQLGRTAAVDEADASVAIDDLQCYEETMAVSAAGSTTTNEPTSPRSTQLRLVVRMYHDVYSMVVPEIMPAVSC